MRRAGIALALAVAAVLGLVLGGLDGYAIVAALIGLAVVVPLAATAHPH